MSGFRPARSARHLRRVAASLLTLALAGASGCSSGGAKGADPAPPTISAFTAAPDSVDAGGGASLVAVFADGTGAIAPGIGAVSSGVAIPTGSLAATTTFTLTVTGAGGVTVTRQATVTVRPVAAPGAVTLVRRGLSGALEPVAGIAVHRSDAATGAFVETRVTDAGGVADFGDSGAARATYSIVRPAASGAPTTVVSFVGVPVGATTLRLDRLPGAPDLLATVDAAVTPSSWGAAVQLPGGAYAPGAVPVTRQDLQSDGAVTLLGRVGGGEAGPVKCAAWRDQAVPADGARVDLAVVDAPSTLPFDADVPVLLTLAARRKDAVFRFTEETVSPSTTGAFSSCVSELPGADAFAVTASASEPGARSTDGWALVDTARWRRITEAGPSLPTSASFTMQDLLPGAVSYDGARVTASATGALAADVGLAVARVRSPALAWHVYAGAGDALVLPEVPGVSPPAWGDDVEVDAELLSAPFVAGFDDLWAAARQLGSVEAALLEVDAYATAALQLTRFTPYYSIWFDGYTWERFGTVTSPDGIDCGASCSGSYKAGTSATLTATPNAGAVFGGWGGDCAAWSTTSPVVVLVDHGYGCAPYFGPASGATYALTVAVAGGWPALVQSDDGQIKCGDDTLGNHFSQCSTTYQSGYGVTLTATAANTATVFDAAWIGDCAATGWSTFLAFDASKACSVELTPRAP